MNDYIDRQAAIDAILHNQEVYSNNFGNDPIDRYTVAIIDNDAQTIAQLPSAEVEPVKHGRWEPVTNGRGGFECSICHSYAPSYQDGVEWLSPFCPNCGARMDLKEEAETEDEP